jgi:hypothetical protein
MGAIPLCQIPLPRLRQIATAPLLADNTGKILFRNGFDSESGIYLWCAEEIPDVPDLPTPQDVARAVAILREPLQDFPFVDDASRATATAIQVTPFVRRLINGPTPLHLIEKATPGTGATLLTDVLLAPAVGNSVQKLTPPKSDHEWEYSLAAVLKSMPSAVVIDNVRELASLQLAKALTDTEMITRVVGSSSVATMPVLCVWVGTGNNPTLHQEIARRTLRCRLDAGVEQPWLREGFAISNLKEWLPVHRAEMIWAVLTIIRSWFVAGQPKADRVLGMFESYSQIIGGILRHAGINDFMTDGALVPPTEDLQTEAEQWLVTWWWSSYGEGMVTIGNLREIVNQPGSPVLELWGPEARADSHDKRIGQFIRTILEKTYAVSGMTRPGATVRVVRCENDPVARTARYRLQQKTIK